jgi:outer membrane protein OmpA-like peptidoglycan-associated protein/tetratricopeptide (TPR) repeat protein
MRASSFFYRYCKTLPPAGYFKTFFFVHCYMNRRSTTIPIFLLAFGFLITQKVAGQWYNPEKVNKKAQMIYFQAIDDLRSGNWESGKNLLQLAIKQEPKYVEAWLSLMSAYGEKKMYDSAIIAYERAWQLDSVFSEDMLLPYSINLAGLGRFAEAKQKVERYLGTVSPESRAGKAAAYRNKTYDFAIAFEEKHKAAGFEFNPLNLGDSINSDRSEYYPSFTIDDSLLVFTRRMQGIREDFYSSRLMPSGKYTIATPIAGDLNVQPSKGGINMSADGEWLFFAGNFGGQGYGDFDIYMCYATPDGWSAPYNLGNAINTEFWESSPAISPDKQTLYFSSNRAGGYGGKDIYMSKRRPDGSWGLAENLGATINTTTDDLAPFIHADNQTLYFTSGGHPGYGGSDLYVTHLGPGGEWSLPENLGYPINTINDDGSLIVAANGTTAYFASFRSDSRGLLDLYRFELPAYAQAKKTQWVRGKVYDKVTGRGLPSAIEVQNANSGNFVHRLVTDELGNYLVTLPVGQDYSFTVSRKGYLFYSDFIALENNAIDSNLVKDIPLQPILENASLELKNILFETNAFTLKTSSFIELDKLVTLMNENPALRVEIGGHTDNVGAAADNLKLSQNRANAVVNYIISKGIPAKRLTAKGYGSNNPVADNNTEAGRARNRRTEMKVIGF